MNKTGIRVALFVIGLAICSAAAFAQANTEAADWGKREFDANCASCHGAKGKGSGPLGELLRRSPPDLTLLARQNKGVFPMRRLYEVIEGGGVAAHGTRDMPVWGREYRAQDAQYYLEARGMYDPDALVRARILSLLEYINRLQSP
ncbi:MAG: hypothetical protein RJA34_2023 [Pseudomonadota bacterium]|jgi:mono/diheme cytochrome c family protein